MATRAAWPTPGSSHPASWRRGAAIEQVLAPYVTRGAGPTGPHAGRGVRLIRYVLPGASTTTRGRERRRDRGRGSAATCCASRPFRSFFVGDAVSQFGDRVSELAFPLIAVAGAARDAPARSRCSPRWSGCPTWSRCSLGAWIDRQRHKKRLLVAADLLRAVLLLTVPVAFAFDARHPGAAVRRRAAHRCRAVLFNTTYPAFFVLLVRRADYLDANSKLSASRSVSFIAGPALGGVLVAGC